MAQKTVRSGVPVYRPDRRTVGRCRSIWPKWNRAACADVLAVYNRPVEPKRPRLCFDERPCQLLDDVVVGLRIEPGKAAKEDNDRVAGAIRSTGYWRGFAGL